MAAHILPTIALSVQLLLVSLISFQRNDEHVRSASRNTWSNSYDFIVVGAGSAGCVVASRLSESPDVNVLLLEAGGAASVVSDMPRMQASLIRSDIDWQYMTTSQKYFGQAWANQQVLMTRGRVLGGSTTLNGNNYNRGNRKDFDQWANVYGARGWNYIDVLPYFIRAENNTDPILRYSPFHGSGGPVQVSFPVEVNPIILRFMNALNKLGYKNIDMNAETQIGYGMTFTIFIISYKTNATKF